MGAFNMPNENTTQPETPALSIVIPAFNEARRIGRTLDSISAYAARTRCELIVVDDGSTDGTGETVRRFGPTSVDVRVLTNPTNRGKGYSVRQGMLAAAGDAVLMCDADLSTPIEELEKLRVWLARGWDVVIGSRDMADSRLQPPQSLPRRWMAWVFRGLRRRLLVPKLREFVAEDLTVVEAESLEEEA